MKKTYPVMLDSHNVGSVQVEKQGLYYQFDCRCSFPTEGVYALSAKSGLHTRSLGTCIPVGNAFGLTTKIPAKYFSQEELSFTAVKKDAHEREIFIPLNSSQPFLQLAELEHARFYSVDGQPGLMMYPNRCCPAKEGSAHP